MPVKAPWKPAKRFDGWSATHVAPMARESACGASMAPAFHEGERVHVTSTMGPVSLPMLRVSVHDGITQPVT